MVKSSKVLCVNCIPITENWLFLEDFLRDSGIYKAVEEKLNVPHYAMAEYGEGQALLAAALEEKLKKGHFPEAALVVDTNSKDGQACISILHKHFNVIYKNY